MLEHLIRAVEQLVLEIQSRELLPESTGSALVTVATIDALNPDSQGDVPTLCSGIPGKYMYQPYCTGSIIMKWYRDIFCEAEKMVEEQTGLNAYTQMDEMVKATPAGADGLIMLPYFQGSGIPELNEKAEGVYYGINAGHTRGHFIRAIMEGLAIALKRMLECEEKLGATMTETVHLEGVLNPRHGVRLKRIFLICQ